MKEFFLISVCLLVTTLSWGQQTIKGIVVDEQSEPLIGVSVLEVGTSRGTITDANGKFTLQAKSGADLQFSYVGFTTQTQKASSNMRIVMRSSNLALNDVVVVAFGKMKREAFTGSAGIMSADDLKGVQVTNATQALAGRVAGLQITNNSSQMGASPSITIRGVGSISSDTEPLIVIDGMPFEGLLTMLDRTRRTSSRSRSHASRSSPYKSSCGCLRDFSLEIHS